MLRQVDKPMDMIIDSAMESVNAMEDHLPSLEGDESTSLHLRFDAAASELQTIVESDSLSTEQLQSLLPVVEAISGEQIILSEECSDSGIKHAIVETLERAAAEAVTREKALGNALRLQMVDMFNYAQNMVGSYRDATMAYKNNPEAFRTTTYTSVGVFNRMVNSAHYKMKLLATQNYNVPVPTEDRGSGAGEQDTWTYGQLVNAFGMVEDRILNCEYRGDACRVLEAGRGTIVEVRRALHLARVIMSTLRTLLKTLNMAILRQEYVEPVAPPVTPARDPAADVVDKNIDEAKNNDPDPEPVVKQPEPEVPVQTGEVKPGDKPATDVPAVPEGSTGASSEDDSLNPLAGSDDDNLLPPNTEADAPVNKGLVPEIKVNKDTETKAQGNIPKEHLVPASPADE